MCLLFRLVVPAASYLRLDKFNGYDRGIAVLWTVGQVVVLTHLVYKHPCLLWTPILQIVRDTNSISVQWTKHQPHVLLVSH